MPASGRLVLALGVLLVVAVTAGGAFVAYSQDGTFVADSQDGTLVADSQDGTIDAVNQIAEHMFDAARNNDFLPVVATVNGSEIRGESVAIIIGGVTESLKQYPGMEGDGMHVPTPREVLDSAIDLELLYQEATRRGLECTQEETHALAASELERVGTAEGAQEFYQAWADYLGVPVDGLADAPEVHQQYATACAIDHLSAEIIPPGAEGDPRMVTPALAELEESLRSRADIQILDPHFE
jgi:hypothetical protein